MENINAIREEYKNYNTNRSLAANTVNSYDYEAFYLYDREEELGMKFSDLLSGKVTLDDYREVLIAHFSKTRENPIDNANQHINSVKRLFKYLDENHPSFNLK